MDKYRFVRIIVIVFVGIVLAIVLISRAAQEQQRMRAMQTSTVWIGIETVELNTALIQQYDIQTTTGLLVSRTFMGSPAEIAGIQKGDIIKRWNGISVTSQRQFQQLMSRVAADEKVKLSIVRQNKPMLIHVTIGLRPGNF